MNVLGTTFRTILAGLLAVIAHVAAQDRSRTDVLVKIHRHLNRTIQRFERLVAHWRNNTLPKPRFGATPQPGAPRPPSPQRAPRLPNSQSWVIRQVDHFRARAYASQLQHFLTTPDCAEFLAACPRAARILRPLTRSLGIQMPGDPPPPPPKPARPPKNPWLNLPPIVHPERPAPDPYPPCFSKAR